MSERVARLFEVVENAQNSLSAEEVEFQDEVQQLNTTVHALQANAREVNGDGDGDGIVSSHCPSTDAKSCGENLKQSEQ